ncbi:pantoate--beta-alanine ligase [Streptomyces sp. NPDC002886]|uniref:pantoate--beta-alanine ligase n=1 Tax=Streptomyces sp. NPDC002886 TaxID=3364667 RepID=UPI00367A7B5A
MPNGLADQLLRSVSRARHGRRRLVDNGPEREGRIVAVDGERDAWSGSVGLVITMGALHAGHATLTRADRTFTIMSW